MGRFHFNLTLYGGRDCAAWLFGDRLRIRPRSDSSNEPLVNASSSILNFPQQDWLT